MFLNFFFFLQNSICDEIELIIFQIKAHMERKERKTHAGTFLRKRRNNYERLYEHELVYHAIFDDNNYDIKRSPLLICQDRVVAEQERSKEIFKNNSNINHNSCNLLFGNHRQIRSRRQRKYGVFQRPFSRRKNGISEKDEIERIGVHQIITAYFLNETYRNL